MPTIPIDVGGHVRVGDIPTGVALPVDRGRGAQLLASAAQQVGDVVGEMEQRARARTRVRAQREQLAALQTAEYELIDDPQQGALVTALGGAARGVTQRVAAELRKRIDAQRDQIDDTEVRDWFEALGQQRLQAVTGTLARHEAAQAGRYDEEQTTASIHLATERAASRYADPHEVAGALAEAARLSQSLGTLRGWSPEQTSEFQLEALSGIHQRVLARIVDQDPSAASEYLASHREQMTAAAADSAEKVVGISSRRAKAQKAADEAWSAGKGDIGAALASARAETDVELRDEIEQRIRQRANDEAAVSSAQRAETERAAGEHFFKHYRTQDVPAEVWHQLETRAPEVAGRFKEMQRHRQEELSGRDAPYTAEGLALLGQFLSMPDEQKKQVNPINLLYGKLPRSEVTQAVEMVARLRNPDVIKKGAELTESELQSFVSAQGVRAGLWNPGANDTNAEALKGKLWTFIAGGLSASMTERGTYPRAEVERLVAEALVQGTQPSWFGFQGNPQPRFTADPERRFSPVADVPASPTTSNSLVVPSATREAIAKRLRARGIFFASDQEEQAAVERIYAQMTKNAPAGKAP